MRKLNLIIPTALVALCGFAENPLTLKFDRPADFFEESFVIGNGSQGAIVYGNPSKERISLNDITFGPENPTRPSIPRVPTKPSRKYAKPSTREISQKPKSSKRKSRDITPKTISQSATSLSTSPTKPRLRPTVAPST